MSQNTTRGHALAKAAATFIGVRFQLQGRDPRVGLDCVGLLACSLEVIGFRPIAPKGYRLRNADPLRWLHCAQETGLVAVDGLTATGDVLLIKPGPGQHHLVIVESKTSVIHAHAGLRKVVRQPIDLSGEKLAHWRLP